MFDSRFLGKLMMVIASKGHLSAQEAAGNRAKGGHRELWADRTSTHFLVQMLHPMQSASEMNAILSFGPTSMQNLPASAGRR